MRPFRMSDLVWLEPIAKEYCEWEPMLKALERAEGVYVDPPGSIVALHRDPHGLCLSACSSKAGIKGFVKMVEDIVYELDTKNIKFHGHYPDDSWQAKLALKMGLQKENGMYVFYPLQEAS